MYVVKLFGTAVKQTQCTLQQHRAKNEVLVRSIEDLAFITRVQHKRQATCGTVAKSKAESSTSKVTNIHIYKNIT